MSTRDDLVEIKAKYDSLNAHFTAHSAMLPPLARSDLARGLQDLFDAIVATDLEPATDQGDDVDPFRPTYATDEASILHDVRDLLTDIRERTRPCWRCGSAEHIACSVAVLRPAPLLNRERGDSSVFDAPQKAEEIRLRNVMGDPSIRVFPRTGTPGHPRPVSFSPPGPIPADSSGSVTDRSDPALCKAAVKEMPATDVSPIRYCVHLANHDGIPHLFESPHPYRREAS